MVIPVKTGIHYAPFTQLLKSINPIDFGHSLQNDPILYNNERFLSGTHVNLKPNTYPGPNNQCVF